MPAPKDMFGKPLTPGPWKTLAEITRANKDKGDHWFDRETIAHHHSRPLHPIYGGRLFVSSEAEYDGTERRWTVFAAHDDGGIACVEKDYRMHAAEASAVAAARALAKAIDRAATLTAARG